MKGECFFLSAQAFTNIYKQSTELRNCSKFDHLHAHSALQDGRKRRIHISTVAGNQIRRRNEGRDVSKTYLLKINFEVID